MSEQIVRRLVKAMDIQVGYSRYQENEEIENRIVDALVGRGSTTTVVIDVQYQLNRWIVLQAIRNGNVPNFPVLIKASPVIGFREKDGTVRAYGGHEGAVTRLQDLGWLKEDGSAARLVSTVEVAGWFVGRANGLPDVLDFPDTWAPAAEQSFARIPMGGDVPQPSASTVDQEWDGNTHYWMNLDEVPVGASVWRISVTDTLWLFTRQEAGWQVTVVTEIKWPHTRQGYEAGSWLAGAFAAQAMMATT